VTAKAGDEVTFSMIALRIRLLRCVVPLAAVLLLASCEVLGLSFGGSGQRAELQRQHAKWALRQITSYRITYRRECFCGAELTAPTEIEVRDGAIVSAHYADGNDPVPGAVQAFLPTIEDLFAIVAEAIDHEADLLEVTYDQSRGYPRKIAIDYRFNTADDEVAHSVSNLEIVLPPTVP
jgi:uncharacterized protein DUF6174